MGMDVSGKAPTAKAGEYFRNSCWGWRPLWNYCREVAPDLIDEPMHEAGHYNDGQGLGAAGAAKLGARLKEKLASGQTETYEKERTATIAAMPDIPCNTCGGTGRRAEPPIAGPGTMPCNGCDATGKCRPTAAHYPFDVENVQEFANFLEACGGFEIW